MKESDNMTLRELAELYKDQPMLKALDTVYEPTPEQRARIHEYNMFSTVEAFNSSRNKDASP